MALYAFDGTWNDNKPDNDEDTNVRKFFDAYESARGRDGKHYKKGPGTRYGVVGSIFGGAFGAGGESRVNKAYKEVKQHFKHGDKTIDIVGFSRGAALALDFANKVANDGVNGEKSPPIRFLGLWDTVASFGVPGNQINIGYKLDLPKNVEHCAHALALDERRGNFKPERLVKHPVKAAREGRVLEVWFRGVHSDVGGGYKQQGLSAIALTWMFAQAKACGLTFDEKRVAHHAKLMDEHGEIHGHEKWWMAQVVAFFKDPLPDEKRKVDGDDLVHVRVVNPPKGIARIDDGGTITA